MGLASYFNVFYGTLFVMVKFCAPFPHSHNMTDIVECPNYGEIEFATLKTIEMGNLGLYAIHVDCNPGYDLIGRHKLLCNDGKWENVPRPQCIARCNSPPGIENGRLSLEGEKDKSGQFKKGTLATYSCNLGFQITPPESKYRVCEKGIWTGAAATCVLHKQISGCKQPKDIANGYYVQEKNGVVEGFGVGQRLHYSCNSGYVLKGPPVQQCLEDGSWSTRIPPECIPQITVSDDDNEDVFLCPLLPLVPHANVEIVRGEQNDMSAMPGTVMAFRCDHGYRNALGTPCDRVLLRCSGGVWFGVLPTCVLVKDCFPPPSITNGHLLPGQVNGRVARYPIGTKVLYQCLPGYELTGRDILSCSVNGCWEPVSHHPSCQPNPQSLEEYMSTSGTLLVSIATASGVMLILLAVCLVVVCRRRKPWGQQPLAQAVGVAPPHPSVSAGESTSALINDPDRLALIAFADGLQVGQQAGLPSYEEAIRERAGGPGCGTGLLAYRPHRPHWTALGVSRRGRPPPSGTTQTSDVHVTRQSSCTSHSASMRSGSAGGDPMGSTDTMTPSEVSTNITLDTVSSHSGSQPASCRAICGSLASFDTSSVLNTEGVPLLEENEVDETPNTESTSNGVDHHSVADNASFKYRRTSPDIP